MANKRKRRSKATHSTSNLRVQKSRTNQSDEKRKAENEKRKSQMKKTRTEASAKKRNDQKKKNAIKRKKKRDSQTEEEKEAGVALIDIGGGTTDLAIFKDGIIRHTAVVPFGGNVITDDIKEGCSIIEKQAELLKTKFGSAWPGENKDNEIVSIPGLRGRDPKEISLKNLSKIIHARVVEIIEQVFTEIKAYGHEDPRKKLIAGIVLTGGGSQLKHIKQLVEYITGMDTRIGYPNEHLAGNSSEEISSPLYATAVGLVMNSIENNSNSAYKIELKEVEKETPKVASQPVIQEKIEDVSDVIEEEIDLETETTENKIYGRQKIILHFFCKLF